MRKILITALILTLPGLAAAQTDRSGSWDFSIGGVYQYGDSAAGQMGSSLKTDNTWGFGFYSGYHINNRFQIGADFDFLRPDYDLLMVSDDDPSDTQRINHTAKIYIAICIDTFSTLVSAARCPRRIRQRLMALGRPLHPRQRSNPVARTTSQIRSGTDK